MSDEIAEELEFQDFMAELRKLQEDIFLAWLNKPVAAVVTEHNDIMRYGNEPVFAGLLFDKILEEAADEHNRRESTPEISD